MNELDKGLAISISGDVRANALTRFLAQAQQWNLSLPAVEPLVLDFGLGDFERVGLIEYWIANEAAAGYCGKYLFVFRGQTCPKHRHALKHETFFLLHGRIEVEYRGALRVLQRGDVLPIEPHHYHRFTGLEPSLLLELSMPCEIDDNYFEDSNIPFGGNFKSGRCD